jgi:hypothetical protein
MPETTETTPRTPPTSAATPPAMTPELFGGTTYGNITVEQIGEDSDLYMALGHVDKAAFAEAALKHHRHLLGSDDFDPIDFDPDDVIYRWGILTDPSTWTGVDEWGMTWADVAEETPGAFQVTMIELD